MAKVFYSATQASPKRQWEAGAGDGSFRRRARVDIDSSNPRTWSIKRFMPGRVYVVGIERADMRKQGLRQIPPLHFIVRQRLLQVLMQGGQRCIAIDLG